MKITKKQIEHIAKIISKYGAIYPNMIAKDIAKYLTRKKKRK